MRIQSFAAIACSILAAFLFAEPVQAKTVMHKVHFPAKSIGKAHVMTSQSISVGSVNGRFLGSASGDYLVPVPEKVSLDLDPRVGENPALLKDLAPDAAYSIRVTYSDTPEGFLPAIAKLSGLHRLDLVECIVTANGLAQLAQLKNLERLMIENSDLKGDYGKAILKIKSLRYLSLAGNQLSPSTVAAISQMPNLEYLCVSRCALSNDSLKSLASLKRLKFLDLSCNAGLNGTGLAYLKACPALRSVKLPFTAIKAHDLIKLKGVPLISAQVHEDSLSATELSQLKKALPLCKIALSRRELRPDDNVLFAPIH